MTLLINEKQKMDGLVLLKQLPDSTIPLVLFDPQYRAILDKLNYGNEGKQRGQKRAALESMSVAVIQSFILEIERVLKPSGHLMLWVDKFILCEGVQSLIPTTNLQLVDMITWSKSKIGMGYRTRRVAEYLVIFQKIPKRAKDVWTSHNIPDVWIEKITSEQKSLHTHSKPIELQKSLIMATTKVGDTVVDPAAGGYSVMTATVEAGRNFIGCDLV